MEITHVCGNEEALKFVCHNINNVELDCECSLIEGASPLNNLQMERVAGQSTVCLAGLGNVMAKTLKDGKIQTLPWHMGWHDR